MVRSTARALHQLGFTFGRRIVFGNDQLTSRFHAAVVGPTDGADLEELRLSVEKKLINLFRICLQSREFYTAVRGSNIFWGSVAEQWDTLEHVESEEVATFVEIYREAREKTEPGVPVGELAILVDQFIEMRNVMLTKGPAEKFQVALRPSEISQTTLGLASLSIGNGNSRPTTTWPPSYYTEQEVAWLSHDHVLSQVYGLTPQKKPTKISDFPSVPDTYTHPLDIRLFLAFTALTNFDSNRKTSLCMTPIMFWDDDERKDWYQASGGASKFCWTTWDFAEWAKEEFKRGREAVVGLCHYHCIDEDDEPWEYFEKTFDPAQHFRRDVYYYEFVMEDAHYYRVSADPKYWREKYGLWPNTGMDFKSALLQDVETHFNVTSFWHGGEVPNAFQNFGIRLKDSVSTSCSFVYAAVQGKVPVSRLDREGWNFSRDIPERMRYWENEEEEAGEDEKEDTGSEDESEGESEDDDIGDGSDDEAESEYSPGEEDDDDE
ncbi:hypothetical protein O1611_g8454 [Lasiodiplodia mahajangana]|uniref:Uncharacterized protein n=1 Tax=Lasiodiplodia mahajangana TaxID=1108764 RepID=A0ACC2JCM2_9PEZI|nr:hypothetical protein O1611_g8454 [Lasiodiplodia mahajangana]